MNRLILFSVFFHLLFMGGLVVANFLLSRPVSDNYRIYRIKLVSLPGDRIRRNRAPSPPDRFYRVVSEKEAARPDNTVDMALKRTPRLVEEAPEKIVERPSFETGASGVKLDIPSFEFPYYLAAIQRKIQQHLVVSRLPGVKHLRTVMYFRISRTGRIYGTAMEARSGNAPFDLAVRRALITSNPLPPLPDGFDRQSLGVHFEFEYVR